MLSADLHERQRGHGGGTKLLLERLWLRRWSCTSVLEGHDGCVNTIRWASGAQLLLSGSDDRRVGVWDFSQSWEGRLRTKLRTLHRHNIFDAQQVPGHETTVMTSAADGRVGLTHLDSGSEPSLLFTPECRCVSSKLSFQAGTSGVGLVPFGDPEATVRVFDVRAAGSAAVACRLGVGCNDASFRGGDPYTFAVAADDAIVRLCDLRRCGEEDGEAAVVRRLSAQPALLKARRGADVAVSGVCWSACASMLLVNYREENVWLFDASTTTGAGAAARGKGPPPCWDTTAPMSMCPPGAFWDAGRSPAPRSAA